MTKLNYNTIWLVFVGSHPSYNHELVEWFTMSERSESNGGAEGT